MGVRTSPNAREPLRRSQRGGTDGHRVQVAVHGVQHHPVVIATVLHQEGVEFVELLLGQGRGVKRREWHGQRLGKAQSGDPSADFDERLPRSDQHRDLRPHACEHVVEEGVRRVPARQPHDLGRWSVSFNEVNEIVVLRQHRRTGLARPRGLRGQCRVRQTPAGKAQAGGDVS